MQKITFIFLILVFGPNLFAQTTDFEGIIDYNVSAKGRYNDISEKDIMRSLLESGQTTVMVRKGNYRYFSSIKDTWVINFERRVYYRFSGIDTLYFREFKDDTSNVLGAERGTEEKNIAGYNCKRITFYTTSGKHEYYYAPDLYNNPEYDKDIRIGRIDAFVKETSSMWLSHKVETDNYSLTSTAARVERKKIEDSAFVLPRLPVKKFTAEAILKEPVFFRAGGWIKYISTNVNADIGAKYLKIPKKETSATQTVYVGFMINKEGKVVNATVMNQKAVHPKLADEALRVVSSSPDWRPATLFGEKTISFRIQPITFSVTK